MIDIVNVVRLRPQVQDVVLLSLCHEKEATFQENQSGCFTNAPDIHCENFREQIVQCFRSFLHIVQQSLNPIDDCEKVLFFASHRL